jgi:hypothetical protein
MGLKQIRYATYGAYPIHTAKEHMDEHPSDYAGKFNTLFLYHCPALVPPVAGWISVELGLKPNLMDLISEGENEACGRASEASADLPDFLEQSWNDCQLAPLSQEGTSTS